MGKIEFEGHVAASPQKAFQVYSDFERAAERVEDIRALELVEGQVGPIGAKWRETRTVMGREATEVLEVTDLQPAERYAVACESAGTHFETVYSFQPEGEGTRVHVATTFRALTLGAKLMAPLSFLMRGMLKKCLVKDFEALKPYAEEA